MKSPTHQGPYSPYAHPDESDDKPERRPRDKNEEEDEPEERPRRRRRDDDDDDYPEARSRDMGPLDSTFCNINVVILVSFGFCCGLIAFIIALNCVLTAKNEKAKSNAVLVLIISGIVTALGVVSQIVQPGLFKAR